METDKMRVLFDLNIILDVLQEREAFYDFSSRLLALAETGRIQGWLAAYSVTTLFYLIAKGRPPDQARVTFTSLLQFLKVAPVDQNNIEKALNLPYRDFKDAVQMIAALQIRADYLLSRSRPGLVFDYVMQHKPVMPRTVLRYPIEKLAPAQRAPRPWCYA
jgi:hypothetical protein